MSNEEILVSVIIPAYNAEQYVGFCLDTVIAQTHKNLEIIVVDDGSTDNTGKICDEYANKDSRINVIHQENEGLSSARNAALDIMTGEYIAFIDSDDFISKDYTEKLLNLCIEKSSQIAACHAFDVEQRAFKEPDKDYTIQTLTSQTLLSNIGVLNSYYDTVISKLFHYSLFSEIAFPVGLIHEDSYVVLNLIEKAKRISFTTEHLYYYYLSPNSIMRSDFSVKKYDILPAFDRKLAVLTENNCKNSIYIVYRDYLYTVSRMIGQTKYCQSFSHEFKKEKIKELRKKYLELRKINNNNPYFKGRFRLVSDLLYCFPIIKKLHKSSEG